MIAAGVIYSLHLGRALDSSEAYTALAAGQTSYAAVYRSAMRFDPGKPPLYQFMLHLLTVLFADSEAVLRVPSVIFSMATVGLLLALGSEMFEPAVGAAAALIWALNPLAVLYGGWARNYAMLVALSMGQFFVLWRLRSQPRWPSIVACGLLGAAMLYLHLASGLFLAAEAAMLAGAAWRRDEKRAGLTALAISFALFLPFVPIASSQVHELLVGHWVDWIGFAHPTPWLRKALAVLGAGAFIAVLSLGPRVEADEREPLRWCAAIGLVPVAALMAGSIVLRPMFAIRYLSPTVVMLVLLLTALLASLGVVAFRLAVFGIVAFLVFLFPYYNWCEPWRDVARLVSSGPSSEPVFFEPIFTGTGHPDPNAEQGFPQGFLRAAFDHYFSGSNPRRVIDPSKPAAAQQTIADAAATAHGAWLITTADEKTASAELPARCFRIEKKAGCHDATLYHVAPLPPDHCAAD